METIKIQMPIKGVDDKRLQRSVSCDPPSYCIKASLKNVTQVTVQLQYISLSKPPEWYRNNAEISWENNCSVQKANLNTIWRHDQSIALKISNSIHDGLNFAEKWSIANIVKLKPSWLFANLQ